MILFCFILLTIYVYGYKQCINQKPMTPKVHNTSTDHQEKDINYNFINMPSKGKKDSAVYSNRVLPIITQGYNFMKLWSFLEQYGFAKILVISVNQTFGYIIDLKITRKN
jgi:hypothetical protein